MQNKQVHTKSKKRTTFQLDPLRTFAVVLFVGFLALEIFNFGTSRAVLVDWLGDSGLGWLLAFVFATLDLGGLARLRTKETSWQREPDYVRWLFLMWVVAALFNIGLTWWWAATLMDSRPHAAPAGAAELVPYIPIVLAAMIFAARFALITMVGGFWDELFSGKAPPRGRTQPAYIREQRPVPNGQRERFLPPEPAPLEPRHWK